MLLLLFFFFFKRNRFTNYGLFMYSEPPNDAEHDSESENMDIENIIQLDDIENEIRSNDKNNNVGSHPIFKM